jgi:hypothetical protein
MQINELLKGIVEAGAKKKDLPGVNLNIFGAEFLDQVYPLGSVCSVSTWL